MLKSTSILAALMGLGAFPVDAPSMMDIPATQPRSNRRPAGAHKAFVRAARKSKAVRRHRARA